MIITFNTLNKPYIWGLKGVLEINSFNILKMRPTSLWNSLWVVYVENGKIKSKRQGCPENKVRLRVVFWMEGQKHRRGKKLWVKEAEPGKTSKAEGCQRCQELFGIQNSAVLLVLFVFHHSPSPSQQLTCRLPSVSPHCLLWGLPCSRETANICWLELRHCNHL